MPQINVLEYLEYSAARTPDKIAFADERMSLTFGELRSAAIALGERICRNLGGRMRAPVLVDCTMAKGERSVLSLVGFFGVLYSGNFYVPLDCELPSARKNKIIEKISPALRITLPGNAPDECIPSLEAGIYEAAGIPLPWRDNIDLDPVYLLFTSGSTGEPKGIIITHRAVIDLADWLSETTEADRDTVIGSQTPFFFDASVKDIYLTLKCGASAHLLPKKLFMFPKLLLERMDELGINSILWATSALHLVASSGILEVHPTPKLRLITSGGEALSAKHISRWRKASPNARIFNLYGPTEITVDCTSYKLERDFEDGEVIPIGYACRNKQILILDENMKLLPPGSEGEICVRGSGVSFGYYNEPELTEAAFVPNPLVTAYREIIYRTGDIGRMDENGCVTFISRRDGQIKHNGYRIGLGETERTLESIDGVSLAVCVFDRVRDRIIALYTGSAGEREIMSGLRSALPKYMLPNRLIKLESMPETPNGKIDRRRLEREYAEN